MSLDMRIQDYFGPRAVSGDVGIEIETEGTRLPAGAGLWHSHEDGSLRGNSREYSLRAPVKIANVPEALKQLEDSWKANKTVINDSPRTSVHVHVNAQRMYLQEVYTLVAVHMIVENLLMHYAGGDRIGNLFCLRSCDAEYLPLQLIEGIQTGKMLGNVTNDNVRYSALNLAALSKFGSVEQRGLRGTSDFGVINEWVNACFALKKAAYMYNDPLSMYEDFLKIGIDAFLDKVFGVEFSNKLRQPSNYQRLIGTGSNYAFMLAHATDRWMSLENVRKKKGVTKEEDMTPLKDEGVPANLTHIRFDALTVRLGVPVPDEVRQAIINWEEINDRGRVNDGERLRDIHAVVLRDVEFRRAAERQQANLEPRGNRRAAAINPFPPAPAQGEQPGPFFAGVDEGINANREIEFRRMVERQQRRNIQQPVQNLEGLVNAPARINWADWGFRGNNAEVVMLDDIQPDVLDEGDNQ